MPIDDSRAAPRKAWRGKAILVVAIVGGFFFVWWALAKMEVLPW